MNVIASVAGRETRVAARSIAQRLVQTSNFDLPISVVRGHDLMGELEVFLREHDLQHAVTGERFADLLDPTVAAVACLGRQPMIAALTQDARVVLVGHESPGDMAAAAARFWFAGMAKKNSVDQTACGVGESLAAMHRTARLELSLDAPFDKSRLGPVLLTQHGEVDYAGDQPPVASPTANVRPDPSQSTVTIVHRRAFGVDAVLHLSHSRPLNRLYRALTDTDAWAATAPSVTVWPSDEDTEELLVRVSLSHPEQEQVRQASRRLRQIAGALGDEGVSLLVAPIPTARYENWPTSLPADSLEWSIDTRTAREWLD